MTFVPVRFLHFQNFFFKQKTYRFLSITKQQFHFMVIVISNGFYGSVINEMCEKRQNDKNDMPPQTFA